MTDQARKNTDKKLAQMERHISGIYKTAGKDIYKKWDAFFKTAEEKVSKLQTQYDDAKKSGDSDKIKETGRRLGIAKRNVLLRDSYYKGMLTEITTQLSNVNQTAAAYVKGELPSVYSINYNQMNADLENYGIKFNIRSPETVKRLMTQGEVTLPALKPSIPKDRAWNRRLINNAVLQGIIQGESIPQIANRIFPEIMAKTDWSNIPVDKMGKVIKQNRQAAVRNARTLVTGAENAGRQDSYVEAEKEGLTMMKVWIATGDSRTRDFHLSMDGQEVGVDEPFIDGNGNEVMFPGDPDCFRTAPETVWNCRCSMRSDITGVRSSDGTVKPLTPIMHNGLHQTEIEAERDRRSEIKAQTEEEVAEETKVTDTTTWVDKIKKIQERTATDGVQYDDIIEAGELLADQMTPIYKERDAQYQIAKKAYEEAFAEWREAKDNYYSYAYDSAEMGKADYQEQLDALKAIMQEKNNLRMDAMRKMESAEYKFDKSATDLKNKLGEVREVGSEGLDVVGHLNNSRSPARKNVEWAYDKYPKSWVEQSINYDKYGMAVKTVDRGYYIDSYGVAKAEIAISGWDNSMKNETAIHELGHRFERAVPEIKAQEKIFYEKRTAGEDLQWLGRGYGKDEKSRFDKFINAYMGKDYGGSAYELVSMGFETVYTNPTKFDKDPEMRNWILGLLTLIP